MFIIHINMDRNILRHCIHASLHILLSIFWHFLSTKKYTIVDVQFILNNFFTTEKRKTKTAYIHIIHISKYPCNKQVHFRMKNDFTSCFIITWDNLKSFEKTVFKDRNPNFNNKDVLLQQVTIVCRKRISCKKDTKPSGLQNVSP